MDEVEASKWDGNLPEGQICEIGIYYTTVDHRRDCTSIAVVGSRYEHGVLPGWRDNGEKYGVDESYERDENGLVIVTGITYLCEECDNHLQKEDEMVKRYQDFFLNMPTDGWGFRAQFIGGGEVLALINEEITVKDLAIINLIEEASGWISEGDLGVATEILTYLSEEMGVDSATARRLSFRENHTSFWTRHHHH